MLASGAAVAQTTPSPRIYVGISETSYFSSIPSFGTLNLQGPQIGLTAVYYPPASRTICSPASPVGATCQFSLNTGATIGGNLFQFTGTQAPAIDLAQSSIVYTIVTPNPVAVTIECELPQTPCQGTRASAIAPATVSVTVRLVDSASTCIWCGEFSGPVRVNGTQLGNTQSAFSFTSTLDQTGITPPAAQQFVPLPPCRIADTRDAAGPYGQPPLFGDAQRNFQLVGRCGIPSGATAVSLNVTAIPRGTLGYLSIWPAQTSGARSSTSLLNAVDGRIKANAAIVPLGVDGNVTVYATDTADVALDVNGYFAPAGGNGLAFYPVEPCRIMDTRGATGPLGGPVLLPGTPRTIPVLSSACNIPTTAKAYSLNATAVPPATLGYLTLWPTGSTMPVVSTLNATTGTVVANAAIVPAGTDGSIDAFANGVSELVLDINGYFAPPGQAGGLDYYPLYSCRTGDTRVHGSGGAYPFPQIQGGHPIPALGDSNVCSGGRGAKAYVLNASLLPSQPTSYLTLYGVNQPAVSTLNALDGALTSNMAIVSADTLGGITIFVTQSSDLILDLSGYFK